MKKIIWISSYPKSGNTWMRFLISNYYFNSSNEFNFQIADNNILMFPQLSLMKKIVDKKTIIENPLNVSKYWLDLQNKLTFMVEMLFFLKITTL